MACLGFRHPQFSEDLAWLPAWLQGHQVEGSEEYQTTTSQPIEELEILQGNINEVKDGDLLSRGSRYKSCHLVFSGEDYSPASFAPSSETVFHCHLHLSSNGASPYTESEFLYGSQAYCDSKKFLPMQQAENSRGTGHKANIDKVLSTQEVGTSAASGKKTNSSKVIPKQAEIFASSGSKSYQLKLDNSVGGVNLTTPTSFPKATENLGVQYPMSDYNIGRQCEEAFNVRYLKDVDTTDVVELSISASEAIVIHELLKSKIAPETLPNAAVLEATLRVKQARLESKENAFHYPNNEIDETDSLLDLDDSTMADACEDVGLCFTGRNEKLVCGSDASPVKDTFSSDYHYGSDDGFKQVDFRTNQKKFPVDPALGLNKPRLASRVDLLLHQSAKEEVVGPAQFNQNNGRNIQKFYVNETSFLSESADIVPDENSFLHKLETCSNRAPQSSVPFEGLFNKPGERILNSQNVSSSVQTLADPLCSFVPCSVSPMDISSPQAQHQNDIEVDAQKWLHEAETLQRTTCLRVESVNGDRQDVPTVDDDAFEAPIRRQLTSLKTYSSLLVEHNPKLDKGRRCHNPFFPSECDAEIIPLNIGWIKAPDKKCSEYSVDNTNLEEDAKQETIIKVQERSHFRNSQLEFNNALDTEVLARKRVHFSEVEVEIQQNGDVQDLQPSHQTHSTTRASKRSKFSNAWFASQTQDVKRYLGAGIKKGKRLILQGFQFLLTGLPSWKEKEIEELIQDNGGMVLSDIPAPNTKEKRRQKSNFKQLLIVLCLKKLKTNKFLYGCAVKALILKVKWLTDSLAAGSVVQPEKYMILSSQADAELTGRAKLVVRHGSHKFIFDRVGIMLHGKRSFYTKFAIVFKHGGGQVFKSPQWLVQSLETKKIFVGCIVAEDERRTSRHLRQFASERKIPMVASTWIIKSLHSGKLFPITQERMYTPLPTVQVPNSPVSSLKWSQES